MISSLFVDGLIIPIFCQILMSLPFFFLLFYTDAYAFQLS